ncbi:MAG TPA: ATP-binding protein [Myxococcaceae bacterium]|nr:ATP-binding protein [Myxococcaceae bacterium]
MNAAGQLDERVLVLTPWGQDGEMAAEVLHGAGIPTQVMADVAGLCAEARQGAAALLLATEVLDRPALEGLSSLLEAQEPWSDLPVVLLTGRGGGGEPPQETLSALGNVTLLERPLEILTLVSALRAAVRTRQRQYGARSTLLELATVLDTVPAAVFTAREGGRRVSGNRYATDLFSASPGANLSPRALAREGRAGFRLFRDGQEIPLEQIPIERAIATGSEVRNAEIDLVVDSEAPRHLVGSAAPLRAPGGEVTGAVAAFVDITEQHRAAQALRDSDRRKTEFLAVLSHELRNPLAAIVNAAHLLSLPRATEQQGRRAREVIERQTGQLSRLVDDLLDLTRIERGKVSLRTRRIDLSETVRRTCEDHQQLFEDRGISLHCRTRGVVWIEADPTRMAQVLGNLLQNAARYGQPGGKVVVEVARRSAVAELRVRDDGRGIAPDLLQRLFTPFVRSEDELSRAHGGLGLGLSLVKGLVELHGGTVQARSDGPGRGAEFIVTLPAVEPPAAAKVDRSSPEARRPLLVLLVEDNRDGAQMLADVLASEGHQVHLAPDGRTALAVARRLTPDVVLCDIGLPDMDGYALAHALRKEPALAHTRLIALSGYAQREDRARAQEAGFEAHLVKPADLGELERVLGLAAPGGP